MEKDDPNGAALVIGAGIAGMQAALDLADSGFKVYLVDKKSSVGGNMIKLDKTFPTGDCAMCTISPKMVTLARHPDIVKLTQSEVVSVKGEAGNFEVTIKRSPRFVLEEKCNGCGICTEVCPVVVPSEHDLGLRTRKAIYIPFPQAVPLVYTLDAEHCIHCGLCDVVCDGGAINYKQKEQELKLRVGAIIVSTGYELFNPAALEEYGYGRYKNVVTNLQFERLLSASGPTAGHVIRPSDGREPKRIAFLQCVGSRDAKNYPYCSRVCCMASTKEAMVAKEHDAAIKPTIFYMDMRSFGKGFQEYVNRAKSEFGIEYIRSRVAAIEEDAETKNLRLRYENTDTGRQEVAEFDLVVLAAALKPSSDAKKLAQILGIDTDEFGYFKERAEEAPFETSRKGIFINGTCQGPKDIPDSVSQASGAAAKVEALLSAARKTLTTKKEKTPETTLAGEPRVGVIVCHCGFNIASVVDVKRVAEYAKNLGNVVFATTRVYTCSDDTQGELKQLIKEHRLNRLVIAACTPRNLEPLFRATCEEAGLNPYLFEMANIREHCSWVHSREPQKATEKSMDIVRMAVAKARLLEPQQRGKINIAQAGLVVGGGVSGMQAALDIADQGFEVHLVERGSRLGGALNEMYSVFLEGRPASDVLEPLRKAVEAHPRIKVHLNTNLAALEGYTGNFEAVLQKNGSAEKVKIGGIIVATGSMEHKPQGEFLYGRHRDVLTLGDLEKQLKVDELKAGNVVFIQCVGARNEERPYCSRTCCMEAVKNAMNIKKKNPATNVFVLYRDIMMFGKYELEYRASQEKHGVKYIRFAADKVPKVREEGGKIIVSVYDTLLKRELEIEADKVILSTPQVAPEGIEELQKVLRVPRSPDGFFMEAHPKLKPLEFTMDGIYLAGAASGPKELSHAIAQASGAAARLCALLSKEVLETEATTAVSNPELCIGCGRCAETCIFKAISIMPNERGELKSVINPAICKGCGACASVCPNGAITARQFTKEQIISMIDELLAE